MAQDAPAEPSNDESPRPTHTLSVPASAVGSFIRQDDAADTRPWDWALSAGGQEGYPVAAGEFVYYRHEGLGIWFGPFDTARDATVALGELRALTLRLREENPERYGTARVVRFRGVGDDWVERMLAGGEGAVELRWLLETLDGLDRVVSLDRAMDAMEQELDGLSGEARRERLQTMAGRLRELELSAAGESLETISREVFGGEPLVEFEVVDTLRFEAGALAISPVLGSLDAQHMLNEGATPSQMRELATRMRTGLERLGVPNERAKAAMRSAEMFAGSGRMLEPALVGRVFEEAGQAVLESMAERAGVGADAVRTRSMTAGTAEAIGRVSAGLRGGDGLAGAAGAAAGNARAGWGSGSGMGFGAGTGPVGLGMDPTQGAFALGRLMMQTPSHGAGAGARVGSRSGSSGTAGSGPGGSGSGAGTNFVGTPVAQLRGRLERAYGSATATRMMNAAGIGQSDGAISAAQANAINRQIAQRGGAFEAMELASPHMRAQGLDLGRAVERGLSGGAAAERFERAMVGRIADELGDALGVGSGDSRGAAGGVSTGQLEQMLGGLVRDGLISSDAARRAMEIAAADGRTTRSGPVADGAGGPSGARGAATSDTGSPAGVHGSGASGGETGGAQRLSDRAVRGALESVASSMTSSSASGPSGGASGGQSGTGRTTTGVGEPGSGGGIAGGSGRTDGGGTAGGGRSGRQGAGGSAGLPQSTTPQSGGGQRQQTGRASSSFVPASEIARRIAQTDAVAKRAGSAARTALGQDSRGDEARGDERGTDEDRKSKDGKQREPSKPVERRLIRG